MILEEEGLSAKMEVISQGTTEGLRTVLISCLILLLALKVPVYFLLSKSYRIWKSLLIVNWENLVVIQGIAYKP